MTDAHASPQADPQQAIIEQAQAFWASLSLDMRERVERRRLRAGQRGSSGNGSGSDSSGGDQSNASQSGDKP
jgi:hypothetical protein